MALKTGEEYKASMKRMKTVVYVSGEKVDRFYEHPLIKPAIETVATGYDLAHNPLHKDCTTAVSHLTGGVINRFTYVATSPDELIKREKQIRLASFVTGECVYQCTGTDAINAAASTTYDVDGALNTTYHKRFNDWLRYVHDNDLAVSAALTDVKGDRLKRPLQQANPDLFLRVVEKRKDGIIIRGAKAHQSGAVAVHEHLVIPCQTMRQGEEQYAVLCAVPADAEGVIHIHQSVCGDALRLVGGEMDFGNIKYGAYNTQMIVFDNVFVPWERVFLCGEVQFTSDLVERFGRIHRCVSSACTSAWIDDFIGVAQSLAEHNGVAKVPHIVDKITQMTFLSGRAFACGIAAASLGYRTPSGVYLPNRLLSNIAKLDGALSINECRRLGIEIAGGFLATAPAEKDYKSPEIGKYIEEFLQGVEDVPTEHRFRMFKLAHHFYSSSGIVEAKIPGSGPSQVQKLNIYYLANLELKKKMARILCGIEEEKEMENLLKDFAKATASNPERREDR